MSQGLNFCFTHFERNIESSMISRRKWLLATKNTTNPVRIDRVWYEWNIALSSACATAE
jgi:hypothetical protein